ncbi:large ribosomal subunit protein uL18-like isoform X2 [Vicia villosa]|uniref:large ribosomal subunit protein uL18-like isoform X2 n=1 Tax=Vicia villosa TaxID=3911 RepID=UPI00273AAFAF|nr:large ribosomal subunit protein uL18-like isoform X2 [Vicia villosa]
MLQATGEYYSVEPADSKRPLRALLDVGLLKTTISNRVFGELKGALDIPHSDTRFAGFDKEKKKLDAEIHWKYIFSGHVTAYMKTLIEDEPEKYQTHFSQYIKKGIEADEIEELCKKVHVVIRADPSIKQFWNQPLMEHEIFTLTYKSWISQVLHELNEMKQQ